MNLDLRDSSTDICEPAITGGVDVIDQKRGGRENPHGIATAGFGIAILSGLAGLTKQQIENLNGVLAVDPSKDAGLTSITGVGHESNSPGQDFVEGINPDHVGWRHLQRFANNGEVVPIGDVAKAFGQLGQQLVSDGLIEHREAYVQSIRRNEHGLFEIRQISVDGLRTEFAKQTVLATGSSIKIQPELEARAAKSLVVDSKEAATAECIEKIAAQLKTAVEAGQKPIITFVGSSHSIATAFFLQRELSKRFPNLEINVLHKGEAIKLYYDNEEEANAAGYRGERTICPETGRVNRWDGVRPPQRERVLDPPRGVKFISYDGDLNSSEANAVLDGSQVIIQGFGWQPNLVDLYDANGETIDLKRHNGRGSVLVDSEGRPFDNNGRRVAGLHAVGFGFGRDPDAISGQIDGAEVVGVNVYIARARKILLNILNQ
jgi:hypothetical protein